MGFAVTFDLRGFVEGLPTLAPFRVVSGGPPPEMRILVPSLAAPSSTIGGRFGISLAAKIAVANPAAPPPMIAMSTASVSAPWRKT